MLDVPARMQLLVDRFGYRRACWVVADFIDRKLASRQRDWRDVDFTLLDQLTIDAPA